MNPTDYVSNTCISVRRDGLVWVIAGPHRVVTLDESNLRITVKAGPSIWAMMPSGVNDLIVEEGGEQFPLSLLRAGKIEISPYHTGAMTGVKIDMSDFRDHEKALGLRVQLFVCLEGSTEELICEVVAIESTAAIKECLWPKAFEPNTVDMTVLPFMQGILLPRDWSGKVCMFGDMCYSRTLYMPWWGHQKGESAAMTILETPVDSGCRLEHPDGGPTLMELRWVHSLGHLRYPRRARICFFEKGSYVGLAKRYRRYVMEHGHFVSLKEKIARSPLVERLIGAPVVHAGILYHIQPESSYYSKEDPSKNHVLVRFDDLAAQLRQLAAKGVHGGYIHLDGWGYRGYDNLHPDILPPCPEAGGWEGMRALAQTCEELNFIFAIHDQYRNYYHDAASYQERHTLLDEHGHRPFESIWYGGNQSILCSSLAPGYVARNHRALLANGIQVNGAYLDVFAVVPPDECYHPEHPVTRADCLKYRGECFDLVRALLGVVSSEEPVDWAIPHLDLVHHGPWPLYPDPGGGPAIGIPVPLFNLVYHDAILLPWSAGLERGGWGIPNSDQGYLHALANAGLPYLSLDPTDEDLRRTRAICALHRRVGLLEMTNHEFLDRTYRRQRTTFSDGTTVTVDFESGEVEIAPEGSARSLFTDLI